MNILGISCFYHDSSACLIQDGRLVAAAQEERFSRLKHDWRFPERAIHYCLNGTGLKTEELDCIIFYEKPLLKFERLIETFLDVVPRGYRSFLDIMPSWLKQKLWLPNIIQKNLGYKGKILFAEHHLSHAAGSFFLSPFDKAAILTIDGVGEWATASWGIGEGKRISLLEELRFPNSLGLLYSTFTAFLGFDVNDGEYKVMGMAPYGQPEYYELIKDRLIDIREDGSLALRTEYFSFQYGRKMFNKKLESLFGIKGRRKDDPLKDVHFNIAASLQRITEEVILKMANYVYEKTKSPRLCFSGGVALNCVANGRLMREGPFKEIFIMPVAGDAGGSIGAALIAYHHYYDRDERIPLRGVYLGPSFGRDQIMASLEKHNIKYEEMSTDDLIMEAASLLSKGYIIGWFQGRMEMGPRALGNRSILADPRRPEMKAIINEKVKFREPFRPFAPSVIAEEAPQFFDITVESPYMLLTAKVRSDKIPAVTHVDGTARLQTIRRDVNPLFYDLLKKFGSITGIPVLLNTSFNVKGEPIVCSPEDAILTFQRSGIDALVMGNFIIKRKCYNKNNETLYI